jgi:hypothetical protein
MIPNFKQARIVSAGATWDNASSMTSVGGSTFFHEIEDLVAYNPNSTNIIVNEFGYFPKEGMTDRAVSGSWISRPLTEDAYDFATPNLTYDATLANYKRTGLFIGARGANNVPLLTVRFYINYEFTFDLADFFGGRLSVPRPLKDETVMVVQVATDVDNILPSFFKTAGDRVVNVVKRYALEAVENMASNTLTAVAAYVGGPPAALATRAIMNVD